MLPRYQIIAISVFLGILTIALSVNAVYYSRFRYELNAATITNAALLCAIANVSIPNFTCPQPVYYATYEIAANEMRHAYQIIMPLDITIMVLVLVLCFCMVLKMIFKPSKYGYTAV